MNNKSDDHFDNELTDAAARIARELKPERDLWPAIQQTIQQTNQQATSKPEETAMPQRSARNTVWAQAAAVLLLVGGSSGLTYLSMSGDNNPVSPLMTEGPALVFEPVSGSFGSQYHLGPDYLDAKRDLEANLNEQLERLSPETRDAVLANIQTIRSAIDDMNKALAEEPDNVLLQKLLLSTYREELALMQHVDGIAKVAMYRGDI